MRSSFSTASRTARPLAWMSDVELLHGLPRLVAREVRLVLGDVEVVLQRLEELLAEQMRLDHRAGRIEVGDPALLEEVHFLREGRLEDVGRARDDRARRVVHGLLHERRHVRQRREEDVLERALFAVVVEEQVVDVRLADLRRVAGIDRAVLAALGPDLLGRVVGEHDVVLLDAERLEVRAPERRRRPDVRAPWGCRCASACGAPPPRQSCA